MLLSLETTKTAFVTLLLASSLTICFFVFLNASQVFVLGDILKIPKSQLGKASGDLTFYDQLLSIPAVWLWGILSDKVGKNKVYAGGYLFMATAFYIYTRAANVYPQLILFRLVFACGASAASSMLTAVVSDMATKQSRGKLSGLVGVCSGCGALIALFLLLRLPTKFTDMVKGLHITYIIVGSLAAVYSIVLFFGLRTRVSLPVANPSTNESSPDESCGSSSKQQIPEQSRTRSLVEITKSGLSVSKDPHIILSYIGSFLARGDTIIITTFIPLLVYKHFITKGSCGGDLEDPELKEKCRDAYVLASILSGVSQTFALVGAPFFGILCDKVYKPLAILISGIISLVGYALVFVTDPTSKAEFVYVSLIGLGEIGMIVSSLALVARLRQDNGSVAGIYSFFGAVGILVNTQIGGYLFDTWKSTAPFFVMVVGHAIFCVYCLGVIVIDYVRASREDPASPGFFAVLRRMKEKHD